MKRKTFLFLDLRNINLSIGLDEGGVKFQVVLKYLAPFLQSLKKFSYLFRRRFVGFEKTFMSCL